MKVCGMEPFIVLPFGKDQNMVFYAAKSLDLDSEMVRYMVYSALPNKFIRNNLVKVIIRTQYIFIIHVYPTDFKEKFSGRAGLNLIIGYIINKSLFKKRNELIIEAANVFFDSLGECLGKKIEKNRIPTEFLIKVNNCDNNDEIIKHLDNSRSEMLDILGQDYSYDINKFIDYKSFIPSYKLYRGQSDKLTSKERLEVLYGYIKNNLSLFNQFWILVNCEDAGYYQFKRVHELYI